MKNWTRKRGRRDSWLQRMMTAHVLLRRHGLLGREQEQKTKTRPVNVLQTPNDPLDRQRMTLRWDDAEWK
jgi:hypothetical protein